MTLTQILQKIREAFYTKKEIDAMGGGTSLSDTISQKANDNNVVHKSGDETLTNGAKTFDSTAPLRIQGCYKGNEFSINARTVLELRSNRDTVDKSGIYISKFRQNKPQGEMGNGSNILTIDVLENGVRTNDLFRFTAQEWVNDIPTIEYLEPATKASNIQSFLGSSTRPWGDTYTNAINGINPGALSLPSISNTGANAWIALDTTDWVKEASTSASQKYIPLADGWLNVRVDNAILLAIAVGGNYMHQMIRSETPNSLALLMPVFKGEQVAIIVGGNENLAYNRVTFYYCQGNV